MFADDGCGFRTSILSPGRTIVQIDVRGEQLGRRTKVDLVSSRCETHAPRPVAQAQRNTRTTASEGGPGTLRQHPQGSR